MGLQTWTVEAKGRRQKGKTLSAGHEASGLNIPSSSMKTWNLQVPGTKMPLSRQKVMYWTMPVWSLYWKVEGRGGRAMMPLPTQSSGQQLPFGALQTHP